MVPSRVHKLRSLLLTAGIPVVNSTKHSAVWICYITDCLRVKKTLRMSKEYWISLMESFLQGGDYEHIAVSIQEKEYLSGLWTGILSWVWIFHKAESENKKQCEWDFILRHYHVGFFPFYFPFVLSISKELTLSLWLPSSGGVGCRIRIAWHTGPLLAVLPKAYSQKEERIPAYRRRDILWK